MILLGQMTTAVAWNTNHLFLYAYYFRWCEPKKQRMQSTPATATYDQSSPVTTCSRFTITYFHLIIIEIHGVIGILTVYFIRSMTILMRDNIHPSQIGNNLKTVFYRDHYNFLIPSSSYRTCITTMVHYNKL